jgi:streptogramin lyase
VTSSDPEPLVIDSSNNAWIVNYGTTTPLDEVGAANAVATLAIGGAYTGGGLAKAELAAIDGAGNIWVTNYTKNAGYVTEFSHAGIAISPATTGFAKSTSYWYGTYGIAVDASGNVWVGNFSSPTFYTEIVGQAAPVVTPLAAGLPTTAGGTSKLGTRP